MTTRPPEVISRLHLAFFSFGTVVKATHAIAGERVAVQVLEKKRVQQADDIERVGRDIQILKLLKHAYILVRC